MKIQKFNEKLGSELTFPDFLKDTLLEEYLECSLKLVYISLSLIISINGTYHIDIDNKDYKDLVFFIKDSEAYKVSKNYNL